jgi:hypothetical protein
LPPKPRSLIIESAKSKPYSSAFKVIALLSSKVGLYCGAFSDNSQPLLPIGIKTPISISVLRFWRRVERRFASQKKEQTSCQSGMGRQ